MMRATCPVTHARDVTVTEYLVGESFIRTEASKLVMAFILGRYILSVVLMDILILVFDHIHSFSASIPFI